jgi:hypothetical protein
MSSSRLLQLARREPALPPAEEAAERCELCGAPIAPEHRHVLDVESRDVRCACRACSVLMDHRAAGGGHFKLIPERRRRLPDFAMSDVAWDELRIPVDMAFFFHSSTAGRVVAYYPSPMGPTESLLGLEAWRELEEANPVLAEMEPDVEALLADRARGARRYWIVPIDDCYRLVGLIRIRWRGFTGGKEVWEEIGRFFEDLDRRGEETAWRGSSSASRR